MQPNQNSSVNFFDRHQKMIIIISIVISIVVILPIIILTWLGFMPGVSNLAGTNTPRNLGVKYSFNDLISANQKTKIEFMPFEQAPNDDVVPANKTLTSNPVVTTSTSITQEEITAILNGFTSWDWVPAKNFQTRFSDGTIEISGQLEKSKLNNLKNYLHSRNINNNEIDNIIRWTKKIPTNAPFYLKGTLSINNNNLHFSLKKAQVGRMDIPLSNIAPNLKTSIDQSFYVKNFNAKDLSVKNGNIDFSGTYPTNIFIK